MWPNETSAASECQPTSAAPIVSVQNHYNVSDRASEDVLRFCEDADMAFLPYFPLATGDLAERGSVLSEIAGDHGATPAQVAIAWLLQHSRVTLPIPGTSSLAHLKENWDARRIALSPQEMEAISK